MMPTLVAVFDDAQPMHVLLRANFTAEGYVVKNYVERLTCLQNVRQLMPDLIVLPYFSGFRQDEALALELLGCDSALSRVPVLVCTTSPFGCETLYSPDSIRPLIVLVKPFTRSDLLQAARQALSYRPISANDIEPNHLTVSASLRYR